MSMSASGTIEFLKQKCVLNLMVVARKKNKKMISVGQCGQVALQFPKQKRKYVYNLMNIA